MCLAQPLQVSCAVVVLLSATRTAANTCAEIVTPGCPNFFRSDQFALCYEYGADGVCTGAGRTDPNKPSVACGGMTAAEACCECGGGSLCPAGQYAVKVGDVVTSCAAYSPPCTLGTTETTAPGKFNDRVCSPCQAGYVGTMVDGVAGCSATKCPAGTYVPAGLAVDSCADAECAVNTVDVDSDPTTPCVPCTGATPFAHRGTTRCVATWTCPPGQGRSTDPTGDGDLCVPCVQGSTFSDADDDQPCQAVRSGCPVGQFETGSANPASDLQCRAYTPCASEQYIRIEGTRTSDRLCGDCRRCEYDQLETTRCTSTTNRRCEDKYECRWPREYEQEPGTATSNPTCVAVIQCQAPKIEVTAATPTSQTVCSERFSTIGAATAQSAEQLALALGRTQSQAASLVQSLVLGHFASSKYRAVDGEILAVVAEVASCGSISVAVSATRGMAGAAAGAFPLTFETGGTTIIVEGGGGFCSSESISTTVIAGVAVAAIVVLGVGGYFGVTRYLDYRELKALQEEEKREQSFFENQGDVVAFVNPTYAAADDEEAGGFGSDSEEEGLYS